VKINVTKGSSPLNLIKYLLDEHKQQPGRKPAVNTNMFGSTAEELSEEFRFSHNLNPRVQQTMAHYSMSLSPGERVEPDARYAITKRLLELTGHEDCQHLSAEHFDQAHKHEVQHWHVGTSNVDLDGNHVEDDFLRVRLRAIEQQLEREFGLVKTQIRPAREQRRIPTGEYRFKERTGVTLPREKLWDKIQTHTADAPSMTTLVTRLRNDGVGVRFRQCEETITGISFELEGWACSGGKLGPAYSFPGLQKHLGVSYDPSQDQALLLLQQRLVEQETEDKELREPKDDDRDPDSDSDSDSDSDLPEVSQANREPEPLDSKVADQALHEGQEPNETPRIVAKEKTTPVTKQDGGTDEALKAADLTQQAARQREIEQKKAHQQAKSRRQNFER